MSLTAPVSFVLLFVAVSQAITYGNFGNNNIVRYIQPLECRGSRSPTGIVETNYDEKHRDCCYQKKTRNDCCILAKTKNTGPGLEFICKCNRAIAPQCEIAASPTIDQTDETSEIITGTPESLCRDLTSLRLFGSKPVPNNCTYAGIARIVPKDTTKPKCNAVYATVYIDNKPQNAFVTPKACIKDTEPSNLEFAGLPYPIPKDAATASVAVGELITRWEVQFAVNGLVYLQINEGYQSLFSEHCKSNCNIPACVYNDTMFSNIDFGNCKMISYSETGYLDRDVKLNELKVYYDPHGCAEVTAGPSETPGTADNYNFWCFKPVKDSLFNTLTDGGAALYCKAKSNKEDILVGVAGYEGGTTPKLDLSEIPVLMLKYKFDKQTV